MEGADGVAIPLQELFYSRGFLLVQGEYENPVLLITLGGLLVRKYLSQMSEQPLTVIKRKLGTTHTLR